MDINELKEIGISKGEIKVYLTLVKLGKASIKNITDNTGLERSGIYDILSKLIDKGLVSYIIEKGKKTYQCAHPKKLSAIIEDKKKALENLEIQIPDLEKLYEETKPKISAEIFRGKEGIQAIFEEILNYKQAHFIGAGTYVMDYMPSFWTHYKKRCRKAKVHWYTIARDDSEGRKHPKDSFRTVKFLPKEFGKSPAVVFIYGDKVANVIWNKDELFAFVIQSKDLTETYKKYHKYLWDKMAISR